MTVEEDAYSSDEEIESDEIEDSLIKIRDDDPSAESTDEAQTVWIGRWSWRQRRGPENQCQFQLCKDRWPTFQQEAPWRQIERESCSLPKPSNCESRHPESEFGIMDVDVVRYQSSWCEAPGNSGCTDSRSPVFDQINGYDSSTHRREAAPEGRWSTDRA